MFIENWCLSYFSNFVPVVIGRTSSENTNRVTKAFSTDLPIVSWCCKCCVIEVLGRISIFYLTAFLNMITLLYNIITSLPKVFHDYLKNKNEKRCIIA